MQCKFSSKRSKPNKSLLLGGIVDLKKHAKENVEKLILATNIYTPFCEKTLFLSKVCLDLRRFEDLHLAEKKKLYEYALSTKNNKKLKCKINKIDVEKLISYAYCNYDMPVSQGTNSKYLVQKLGEFVDSLVDFPSISPKSVANNWLQIVENHVCKIDFSKDSDDGLIDKGCLAGAFCNSTLFQATYFEISHMFGFYEPSLDQEIRTFCNDYHEQFIEEAIDVSYSIWSDFLQFEKSSTNNQVQSRLEYIQSLDISNKTPSFILDGFKDKGELRKHYQLQVYKYFVACVLKNSDLIIKARKEFGCDN